MVSQPDTLKVMHIISDLDVGGGQSVVRTLTKYLALENCIPIVCTFRDGPLRQDIEKLGIAVEILAPRRYSIIALPLYVADMARILRSLARLVRKHQVDVIQTHLLRTLDLLVLLLRWTRQPQAIFWTFHSANLVLTEEQLPRHKWLLKPKQWAHRQLYRLAAHWVSGMIVVSDQVKESALDLVGSRHRDQLIVIPNGCDIEQFGKPVDKAQVRNRLGLSVDSRLIAAVGTLKKVKGHRYLIQAMSTLVSRYPDLHVLLIGDGELKAELQLLVSELGLEEHIHFLGSRHDIPRLLAASDLFVLSSLWEGLSMALLEAMATGLPIVASAVSGTIEAIRPNEGGFLVPPGDVAAMASAIGQLLSDPERAQVMGAAARQRVQAEFSASRQAREHIAAYRRALGSPASRAR
jgi:glycosyltransferase involved in cell wall biosynthesis